MENKDDKTGSDEVTAPKVKKPKRFFKFLIIFLCIIVFLAVLWIILAMIGRVKASEVIPEDVSLRVSVSNPVYLLDNVLAHESLEDISSIPAFAQAAAVIDILKDNPILKNRLVRFAAGGNLELALFKSAEKFQSAEQSASDDSQLGFTAAWDFRFLSPVLRILPVISGFLNIPNLYYVQAGKNSRFELRLENMTLFIGRFHNLLFASSSPQAFESRSVNTGYVYTAVKPSSYDAAFVLSNNFINSLLADQDQSIASALETIEFNSAVEAGLSVLPKKIEFRLGAPLSSHKESISHIIDKRSQVPVMAELIPSDAQYATILSAGTLNELYQAALVFSPGMDSALRTAETASRAILGLTLNDLLFSWTGKEFAAFGLEGRPHPVYAIQIADERRRQEVFDRAFRSIVLKENVRLNIDGVRIPRIEVPEFLQALLRQWDIFIPSPYYIVYRDYFLASESADALHAALRAMQRNDVLPKTAAWRDIAGGKSIASAVSLYYSLDMSMPFFLRNNTALSGFLSLYRQGLIRISFDKGAVDFTLSLVPGSGNGVTLVNGYPVDAGARPSNRVTASGSGDNGRIFYSSGGSAFSLKVSDNTLYELPGQGAHWIIPAHGEDEKNASAWVVTDRGRVTLTDGNMEPASGFPVLMGLRLSSPPQAFDEILYLCDEDGKVYTINKEGRQNVWETVFISAVRSPPSFIAITEKRGANRGRNVYAAVYPKSFFGEIWLLDVNGNPFPNWPALIAVNPNIDNKNYTDESGDEYETEEDDFDIGVGFGSPLLFAHNNAVHAAFVNQSGQLIIYDENADVVKPFPVSLNGLFYQQPVFDGAYLWLVSSEGNFFRVSMDGEVLHQNIPGFSVMEEGYITFFDSNGDKEPEIYITGEGNALHAYTRHFRSLESFPLPVWGKPLFVPVQGNKKAEIFGIGMDRKLYRWQFR